MKHLLSLSLMVLFLALGSTNIYAQCNPGNSKPSCKKICEKVCAKSAAVKTASNSTDAKAACVATCKKSATAKQESSADFVQALLVSQKVEPSSKTAAPKCSAGEKKKACSSHKE